MGPRSHERGNTVWKQWVAFRVIRFNGAAFSRTRKLRGREVPEGTRASFNGAAFSRTRKRLQRQRRPAGISPASMGPRSHERGNGRGVSRYATRFSSFNGAAFSRTRKPAPDRFAPDAVGDASMGPRSHERGNFLLNLIGFPEILRLQWGRVLTNAETRRGYFA